MPKPSQCDCPDCNPPAWVIPPAPPLPSLPSLARTRAEGFVADTMRALDSLSDPTAGQGTRDPSPGPQTVTGGLSQDARELFARRTVATNHRLGAYIDTRQQQRQTRVDYTTPGYQPPEAA